MSDFLEQARALRAAQRQAQKTGEQLERHLKSDPERPLQHTWPQGLPHNEALARSLLDELERPCDDPLFDAELLKTAGLSALVGVCLDLALVGDITGALGSSLMSALGAPEEHLSSAPKVPFDKTLSAEMGATGNHRWNSLSHHPTLVGLISGIQDTLSSTSTHIVDAEVVTVASSNAGVERALREGPALDPKAWAIEKILWAASRTLSHWWSDVNTSMGLPGPLSTLAKCFESGSLMYEGMELNIADYSYELYRAGLDMRRYLADGIVPLSAQLVVRWCAWSEARGRGLTKKEALGSSLKLSDRHQRALLLSYAMISGANLGKVLLTGNPLLLNVSQWVALARLGLRRFVSAHLCASTAEDQQRAALTQEALVLTRQLSALQNTQHRLSLALSRALGVSTLNIHKTDETKGDR